jgi:hypothetical protein
MRDYNQFRVRRALEMLALLGARLGKESRFSVRVSLKWSRRCRCIVGGEWFDAEAVTPYFGSEGIFMELPVPRR